MDLPSTFSIFLVIACMHTFHLSIAANVGGAKTVIRHVVRDSDEDFCYEDDESCGPTHWDGSCNDEIHKHQSPIEIKVDPDDFRDSFQTLQFSSSYDESFESFYIENNGHSIQISLSEDDDDDYKEVSFGYGQESSYVFSQVHFHWGPNSTQGSEHTLNSTRFPMEIHLVHHLAKYDELEDALDDSLVKDSVSVLGIFVEVLPDCNTSYIFEPIAQAMKTIVQKPSEKLKVDKPLKLSSFLPQTLDFFGYDGSLTTPSCAEAVKWAVVQKPICISPEHLQVFRRVKDEEGQNLLTNHRPVQPLGNRVVKFYNVRRIEIPEGNSSAVQNQSNWKTWSTLLALNIIYFTIGSRSSDSYS